jgi:hypothetical protein
LWKAWALAVSVCTLDSGLPFLFADQIYAKQEHPVPLAAKIVV